MDEVWERGVAKAAEIAGPLGPKIRVDADLRELIVRYAFGTIWDRPGLDTETRRLLTMAMTIASNHYSEFRIHLEYALRAGVSRDTLKEVILHSAIYCGIPAALTAFQHAEDVYADWDQAAKQQAMTGGER
jgi:alkylhydroperoxidase/carboxymuconolactone decarboxylase family protein YurZ